MSESKKNSADDLLSKGVDSAGKIQSAVKAGKAIAGISKGAAVGGPYGAIAMGVWQNRKTVVKIVLAAAFVFLLPILFILMLPSIIFGGLKSTDSPDNPIMNDNSSIYSNIDIINTKVAKAFTDIHSTVLEEVNKETEKLLESDKYEIVDLFAQDSSLDIKIFISQYCASKDNYEDIDVEDMIFLINKHKESLFSWTKTTTIIEVEALESEEEPDTSVLHTYTISFVGQEYFTTEVFLLDEKQIEMANNYAENLELFLK